MKVLPPITYCPPASARGVMSWNDHLCTKTGTAGGQVSLSQRPDDVLAHLGETELTKRLAAERSRKGRVT